MDVTVKPGTLQGTIAIPASKSHTIRALIVASLAEGTSRILLPLESEDTRACLEACRAFGPITLRQQPEGGLGERMNTAIAESHSPLGCLVVGTDCPVLTPGALRRAANSLHDNEAVVVPAENGGYVLIGLREADMNVFSGVDWGTGRVMSQTRLRFAVQGGLCAELETLWDIDRPEDDERLLETYPELAALAADGGEV